MRKYIFILFALTTALSSCVSYDAEEFTGKTLPRVTGYTTGITNDWLYINLRTGKIFNLDKPNGDIKEGEQRERTDWDIAFCGYRMRTNSGTSGNGKGGAADLGYGSYDTWKRWRNCQPIYNGWWMTIRYISPCRKTTGTSISSPINSTLNRILGSIPIAVLHRHRQMLTPYWQKR